MRGTVELGGGEGGGELGGPTLNLPWYLVVM